jgi:hypothetical protein
LSVEQFTEQFGPSAAAFVCTCRRCACKHVLHMQKANPNAAVARADLWRRPPTSCHCTLRAFGCGSRNSGAAAASRTRPTVAKRRSCWDIRAPPRMPSSWRARLAFPLWWGLRMHGRC